MKKICLLVIAFLSFGIVTVKAQFTDLLNFNGTNGSDPRGALTLSGNVLFGVTSGGGAYSYGNIFSIHIDGTHYKDLFDFNGTNGLGPTGSLVLSITGDTLFGVTASGGAYTDGNLFCIDTNGSSYTDLFDFSGDNQGLYPSGNIILVGKVLYGATESGGYYSPDAGNVFSIHTDGSGYTDLFNFNGTDGFGVTSLTLFGNVLYGTASTGGANGLGCIYSIHTDGNSFKDMYDFNSNSAEEASCQLAISNGVLYGVGSGGTEGIIFSIDTNGSGYKNLFSFNYYNGEWPTSIILSGGTLYGTTYYGDGQEGYVYSIDTNGSGYTDLFTFNGTDGKWPTYNLIVSSNILYGTTEQGGANNSGVIFSCSTCSLNATASVNNNVSCNGGNNGSVSITPSAGTSPYTYSWSNGATNAINSALTVGTYTVTVADNHGCTFTASTIITQPSALTVLANTTANEICNGGSTGSVSSTPTGGTSPYTYLWSSGGTNSSKTGITAGTYTITLKDNCGATATATTTVTQPTGLSVSANTTVNITCHGGSTGSVSATPSGGTSPYTYSWSGSGTSSTKTGLSAGTYTITLKDNCGVSATASVIVTQPNTLTVLAIANASCSGSSNGSVSATPSGGTSPYTYSWSGGGSNATKTGLSTGTFTITLKDNCGASATASAIVTQSAALSVKASATTNENCNGGNTGSLSSTPSGGTSPYTYSWSGGGTNSTKTGITAGTYTVTITDNHGCTATGSATITQPVLLTVSAAATANVSCNGGTTGSVSSTPTGGISPYTYLWSGGGTSSTKTGLLAGTYTITITDKNGCTATASVPVTQPAILTVSVSATANVSCNGGSTGSISSTPSGGKSPYTYTWSGSGTNSTKTGLSAGTYSITVKDNCGASATASITITQPTLLTVSASVTANENCGGGSTGSISSTPTGGTSPYTYSWSGGGTNSTKTGISAGTYTITVTDNHECTATASASITQPTTLTVSASTTANISCNGGSTGSVSSAPSGGVPPYTYSWSGGGSNSTKTALSAGTYTITVTDTHGCTATASATITQPILLTVSATATANVSCNGGSTGSVSSTPTGGTSPYTYSWSGGGTSSTKTGLSAGTYTITITDKNGCAATASVPVTQPSVLTVSASTIANVNCNGGSTGSVSATPTGGKSPYTYSWSGSGTNSTKTGLSAGTYTITAKDNCGASATAAAIVTQPAVLTVLTSAIPSCNGTSNGSVSATPSGGTSPYTYSWSGGGTSSTKTGLSTGTYTITLKDNCGASATAAIAITQPAALTVSASTTANVSCNGGSTGSISSTPSGGTIPYTYSWSGGGTSSTKTGLSAGSYTITVTDNHGCTTTASTSITQPVTLSLSASTTANVNCNGGSTGSVSVAVSGGTTPYSYSWSGGGTGSTKTGLSAGSYTITVTDKNGCSATASASVTQPSSLGVVSTTQVNVSCNGGNNGSLAVTISGGTLPYTYSWTNGATTSIATGLPAEIISYTVRDNCGAIVMGSHFTITQPNAITLSASSTNVSCNGGNNGSVSATVSGGTTPYTYSWSGGAGTNANTSGLIAGTYKLNLTDHNGCFATVSVTITQPSAISVSTNVLSTVTCNGGNNGSVSVSASGGTAPYTYQWSDVNNQTTATATGLSAGKYYITITDNNGCHVFDSATITQPNALSLSTKIITNIPCSGDGTGSVSVTTSGGVSPYTYQWSDINNQTTDTANTLSAGTYYVLVTDKNGCSSFDSATVSPLIVSTSLSSPAICLGSSDSVKVTIYGGEAPYTYSWVPSTGLTCSSCQNPIATPTSTTTYTLSVTDNNGCSNTQAVTITVNPLINVTINATSQSICSGSSDVLTANGATSYIWNTEATTSSITVSPVNTSIYTVTGTSTLGCAIVSTTITVNPLPNVTVTPSLTIVSPGSSNTLIATGATTYSWSTGATASTITVSPLVTTTYTVEGFNTNGCSTTAVATVSTVGNSCNSVIPLAIDTTTNYVYHACDTNGIWFSFVADSSNMLITMETPTLPSDTPVAYTQSLQLYSGADTGLVPIGYQTELLYSDTLLNMEGQGLTIGQTYYVRITKYNTSGCRICTTYPSYGAISLQALLRTFPLPVPCNGNLCGNNLICNPGFETAPACAAGPLWYELLSTTPGGNTYFNGGNIINVNCLSTCPTVTTQMTYSPIGGCFNSLAGGGQGPILACGLNHTTIAGSKYAEWVDSPYIGNPAIPVANQFPGSTATEVAWQETGIPVAKGSTYQYSMWVYDLNNPATLIAKTNQQLYPPAIVNMVIIGATFTNVVVPNISVNAESWNQASICWQVPVTVPPTTSVTLQVTVQYFQNGTGYDFAFDDLSFQLMGPTATITSTNIKCGGGDDGSATVAAEGGSTPYTYLWSPTGGTNATANNLSAGNYTVTVTDHDGCTGTASVTITQPPPLTLIAQDLQNERCYGSWQGIVEAIPSGGTTPYTYKWSPGGNTSNEVSHLSAGTYTVKVTDHDGCSGTASVTITQPTPVVTTVQSPNECYGLPIKLCANSLGGTPTYSYSWSANPLVTGTCGSPNCDCITYLVNTNPFTFTVVTIDANGCTETIHSQVDFNPVTMIVATLSEVKCYGGSTGIATMEDISGGTLPYTYLWEPSGQTTATATGLPIGTYTATITDANGCSESSTTIIDGPPIFNVATCYVANVNCKGNCNGSADACITGGTLPYTYSWSTAPIQTNNEATGLCAGTYTVTLTDNPGCSVSATVIITQPATALAATMGVPTDPLCSGETGSATVTASGGTPTYTYDWSPTGGTNATANGLSAGSYTVTVTDHNGCKVIESVTITQPPAITLTTVVITNPSCTNDGSASVNSSGGISPYTYSWNTTPPQTTSTATGLSAGNYTITVTDKNGCIVTASVIITQTPCCNSNSGVAYSFSNSYTVTPSSSITFAGGGASIGFVSNTWVFDDFSAGSALEINGTLTLDANAEFDCSDVLMEAGSQIIVNPGHTLTINSSHLHADCRIMWDNITVEPGATLIVENNSLIEDAQEAVLANSLTTSGTYNPSTLLLSNSIFNKNNIGVEVTKYIGTTSYPITLSGCTFSCDLITGGLKCGVPWVVTATPTSLIAPLGPLRSDVGILIDNVNATSFLTAGINVGGSTVTANHFQDMDGGIYSEQSSITVLNDYFTNINTPSATSAIKSRSYAVCAGVFTRGGETTNDVTSYTLNVGSYLKSVEPCYFTECNYGVYVRDTMNAVVSGNYFNGLTSIPLFHPTLIRVGVYLYRNFGNSSTVDGNSEMENLEYGVETYQNPKCVYNIISNNIQGNTYWTKSWGVSMIETAWNKSDFYIEKNTISLVSNGVFCELLNSPVVSTNTITITGLGTTNNGIELADCGTSNTTVGSQVTKNIINYTGTNGATNGIELTAPYTAGAVLSCNALNNVYNGIYISGSQTPIAIEKNTLNMPNSASAYGMYLNSAVIGTNTTTQTNTWNTCSTPPHATFSNLLGSGNGFIVPSHTCTIDPTTNAGNKPVVFTVGGTDTYGCGDALPPSAMDAHTALVIVNDSIPYPVYAQTSNWMAKHGLYYYLNNVDSSLVVRNTTIQHFLDSTRTSNLGKIVEIDQLLGDSNGVSTADLNSALSLNNSLTSPDTAEATYQTVFNVLIALDMDSTSQGMPALGQIKTLQSIAPLCPLEYGGAVFVARALLSQVDTTTYISPCEMGPNKDSISPTPICTDSNPNTILIVNATASSFSPSISHDTLKTIYINGTFTVDRSVTFMACDVNLGTGAQIIIEPGDTLTLTPIVENRSNILCTHLHAGCGNMWNGIHIMPGGTLIANVETLIEDADTAINAEGTTNSTEALYQLNLTTLNKNHVDIYIGACPQKYHGSMYDCIFTCRKITPCNYSGWLSTDTATLLPPFSGYRTSIGISLNQVDSINIGTQNSFDNMDAGIYSYGSNTTIINNTFENIASSIAQNSPALLTGICAIGDTLLPGAQASLIAGGSSTTSDVFQNCKYGVWVRDLSNVHISYNTFTMNPSVLEDGIVLYSNQKNTSLVSYNTMNNFYTGVFCYRNLFSSVSINHNTITGSSQPNRSYGIQVSESPASLSTNYAIDSNTISNTTTGIFATMLNRSAIIGNSITVNGAGSLPIDNEGIYLAAPFGDVISENSISNSTTSGANGIRIDGGKGSNSITCNTVNQVTNGLVLGGTQSPNTFIDQNYLNGATLSGLYLYSSGDIGRQGSMETGTTNTFNATAPPYATYTDSSSNPNGYSHFNVAGSSGEIYPSPDTVMNYAEGNARAISFTLAGPDCYTCVGNNNDCITNNVDATLTGRIINDYAKYTLYPSSSHWLEKNALYKYLLEVDSSLAVSDTSVKIFLDTTETSTMGMLEKMNALLADSSGNSGDANSLLLLSQAVANNMPDTVEATTLSVFQVLITMEMCGETTPDNGELNILQMYAPLCPYQYGTGVYVARALLAPVDSTDYSNSCELIGGNGNGPHHRFTSRDSTKQQTNNSSSNSLSALVYPNPASTMLNIALFAAPAQQAELQGKVEYLYLYDQMGALVLSYQLTGSLTTIPVNSLAVGIYHYRIMENTQNPIKTGDIVIMR